MVAYNRDDMDIIDEKFNREAVEEALCRIAEVEAARIVSGSDDVIDELHIIALPDKGPKQIVRDIESTLMAKYGLAIDHKKISIAQLGGNGTSFKKTSSRLRIGSVSTEDCGLDLKVIVELLKGKERFFGEAKGVVSRSGGGLKLKAEATLAAAQKWTKTTARFLLEDAKIVSVGQEEMAVAYITMITDSDESGLCGGAMVRNNNHAIVKAVLAAINRRIGI